MLFSVTVIGRELDISKSSVARGFKSKQFHPYHEQVNPELLEADILQKEDF